MLPDLMGFLLLLVVFFLSKSGFVSPVMFLLYGCG